MTTAASGASPRAGLAALVLAAMASQSLLIVLGPTIVAIGDDLHGSVGVVSQARSITACVALAASIGLAAKIDALGSRRLLNLGGVLAVAACAMVGAAPTLAVFLAAHTLVGLAFAFLLSAGFAGIATFAPSNRSWATGYVAAANAAAWIIVNPLVGLLTGWVSWRVAQSVPAAVAIAALVAARRLGPAHADPSRVPIRVLLHEVSVRRWVGSELIAYGAWSAFLMFSAAFFMEALGLRPATVGWVLAFGPAAYILAAVRSRWLVARLPRRYLVAVSAMLMGVLLPVFFLATGSVIVAVATCCVIGLAAGVRTPVSAGLGLEQLPERPGVMMATRTAATQLGYLLGAVIGGAVLTGAGYVALGLVLAAGLAASALLVLRVTGPGERAELDLPRR